jgi:hypothetical protein
MDGEIVGSVFLVKKSKRWPNCLLVEPKARLGIGILANECIRFVDKTTGKSCCGPTRAAARHLKKLVFAWL